MQLRSTHHDTIPVIYELIFSTRDFWSYQIPLLPRRVWRWQQKRDHGLHSLYTLSPTYYRNGTRTSSCLDPDNSRNFVLAHPLWRAFGASSRPKGLWENLTCGTFIFFLYNDVILTISSAIMSLLIYTLWGFLSFVKCKFSLVQLCAPFDKLASMVATSCIWIVLSVVNRNGPFNTARMPRSLPWAAWSEFFPSYLSLLSFPIPGGVWFSHHYLETCFFRWRMATPESRCYSYIYTEANPQR